MRARALSHLTNGALLSALDQAEARDRAGTVELLGYLAEVDRRRLYVPAGHSSMFEWCVKTRHYSEAMASRRIAAARSVRRFPVIQDMIADGRLHLSAIALLSKKLTERNAGELLAAAVHKSRREIELLLAERFPQSDVATRVRSITVASSLPSPVTVNFCADDARSALLPAFESQPKACADDAIAPGSSAVAGEAPADEATPADLLHAPAPRAASSRVAPIAPRRFSVQFTMDEAMHADLERALSLLAPQRSEDRVREVFRRALHELVTKLQKQKFAAISRPRAESPAKPTTKSALTRPARPGPATDATSGPQPVRDLLPQSTRPNPRYIPASNRREVWERDQGRCTFVATTGHRCEAQAALEYDHIVPVARGGTSTAGNLRLLCRAHNQHVAEQIFGEGFMHEIRERAREAAGAMP